MRGRDDRRRAEQSGRRAETYAAWSLQMKGYQVLARRLRSRSGEIDLIVRRGRTIAFVEVKQRQRLEQALDAITQQARQRIAKAALAWWRQRRIPPEFEMRFDVVVVTPRRWPRHFPGALIGPVDD